jgi:hypothetical protein
MVEQKPPTKDMLLLTVAWPDVGLLKLILAQWRRIGEVGSVGVAEGNNNNPSMMARIWKYWTKKYKPVATHGHVC